MIGRIIKAISGFYYVLEDNKVYECKARGNFRRQGITPLVGDFVIISASDDTHGVIERIEPRKNSLARPAVSNIDKLFIVSSYNTPAPDLLLIDRLSALAVYNGIEPVIVFNKADMGDFSQFADIYEKAGFKTYIVSALTGEGIDRLKSELRDCVAAFSGNSGVGKSSILNAVFGETFNLATGEVSDKLGRGRHTTRHTELYRHNLGGFVADTPGFSSLENIGEGYKFKEHLPECFPEFSEFTSNCKFVSCTHTCEKGCAVLSATADGKIPLSRHQSYCSIYEELKNLKEWDRKNK